MSTPRVLLGNRPDGLTGLFVSQPDYDVRYCDLNDPAQTAFSSTWTNQANILMSGTTYGDTWVSLPAGLDFWPPIYFDRVITGTQYAVQAGGQVFIPGRPINYAISDLSIFFQIASGIRQFQIRPPYFGSASDLLLRYVVLSLVP